MNKNSPPKKSKGKKSVLIVDDEESIRVSLEYLLKNEKYLVNTVPSSCLALEKLKNNNYELVLTDIVLGDLSGIDLLKKIKETSTRTLVIIMTGYASLNTAINALRLGASDYLIKPCSKQEILSSIKKALKNKKTTDEPPNKFRPEKLKIKPGEKSLTKKELRVL